MLDPTSLRRQFPALQRTVHGRTPVYLDGPGGTQVPQRVIDAMVRYLTTCNANHGGAFTTSRESDAIVRSAHEAVADFSTHRLPKRSFSANMTTLTFHLSRAFGSTLKPGDEVLVTRLDHDANVRPWVLAARRRRRGAVRGRPPGRLHPRPRRPAAEADAARSAAGRDVRVQPRRYGQRREDDLPDGSRRRGAGVPRRRALRRRTARSTCRIGTATSWRVRRTSSSARTSASCGAGANCWRRCRRTRCVRRRSHCPTAG